jgi:hypothetical protein
MKKTEKLFDCVKLMRDIRTKIHEKYEKNPELRQIQLDRIKEQYGFGKKTKNQNTDSIMN